MGTTFKSNILRCFLMICYSLIFIFFLVGFKKSYNNFIAKEKVTMEYQAFKIAFDFIAIFNEAEFLLNQIAKEISKTEEEKVSAINILTLLSESYDKTLVKGELSTGKFYWIDNKNFLVATSDGVIHTPIDLSDRIYLQKTSHDFNKIYNGDPIIGALSHRYVLPMGVGVGDKSGKYLGTLVASFQISEIIDRYLAILADKNAQFIIADRNNTIIVASDDNLLKDDKKLAQHLEDTQISSEEESIANFDLLKGKNSYVILNNFNKGNQKILVAHENSAIKMRLFLFLLPQILGFLLATIIFAVTLKKYNN